MDELVPDLEWARTVAQELVALRVEIEELKKRIRKLEPLELPRSWDV